MNVGAAKGRSKQIKSTIACDTKRDAIDLAATINSSDHRRVAVPCASFYGSRTTQVITCPIDELRDLAESVSDAYTQVEDAGSDDQVERRRAI